MKIKEAEKIVALIIRWQLVLQGVIERKDIKREINLSDYSLEDLIKTNKIVESNNSRKRKLQEYWRNKIGKSNGVSQQITLADRLIAGVYVALHFQADKDIKVLIDDIGVGCTTVIYD